MQGTDKPTVLFVATPAVLGGSNRSLATVLASLEGQVHRALACPPFGSFIEYVDEHKLADEIIALPRKPQQPIDRLLRVMASGVIARWAFQNRKSLTAIHANALTGLNLSTPAALVTQKPTVLWIHDPVGSAWGRRLGPILRRVLPKLRITAVSPTAEAVAVENGLCDVGDATIIANPIDPQEVLNLNPPAERDSLHIGYVGGASLRKGFDMLPTVISGVADLGASWKLYVHLVPDDENRAIWDELSAFSTNLVERVGKTPNIAGLYANLDIVFIPSRAESFCRVAAEAMMNGVPVVASDIDPLQTLLGEEEAGLMFPNEDVEAAVAKLRTVILDKELRERLGAAGRVRSGQYGPARIAEELLAQYR